MYTLYTDKSEDFKCKISVEGSKISETKARLIIHGENTSLFFEGSIHSDGTCVVPIKRLKNLLNEGETGTMVLEVISEDTFFSPWEDKFSVKVEKKVTVEVNEKKEMVKENKITVEVLPQSINESTEKVNKTNSSGSIINNIKKSVNTPAKVLGATPVKQPVLENKILKTSTFDKDDIKDFNYFKEIKIKNFK